MKTSLDPPGLPKPVGPFAHVTHAPADGRLVFCAGTVALERQATWWAKGISGADEQVMENLQLALDAAGATFADVVKITNYVLDVSGAKFAAVRARYLKEPYPASTFLEVSS